MVKRTTVELDPALIDQAKEALGVDTARAAIEQALRQAVTAADGSRRALAARQARHFQNMDRWADLDVLRSAEMWR